MRLYSKKPILVLLLIVATLGVSAGSLFGYRYLKTTTLITQATGLEQKGNLEESQKSLIKAKEYALTKTQTNLIKAAITETETLLLHKSYYEKGVKFTENGQWEKALLEWENIAEGSPYTNKYKTVFDVSHKKPTGDEVILINYTHSKDPTWKQLLDFLKKDSTDGQLYDLNTFVCTGFAETLHNNAEKSGIKAAYIGIRFTKDPGHAITAFNTTDKGLIYVDNTGKGNTDLRDAFLEEDRCEWDKIAYLEENKDYGSISINYPGLEPTKYESYTEYTKLWVDVENKYKDLLQEIDEYNKQSKTYKSDLHAYEVNKEKHGGVVDEYNKEAEEVKKTVEQENQNIIEAFNKKVKDWELKKETYEVSLGEYNSKVEKFNKDGKGDYDSLVAEGKQLENEQRDLERELEKFKKEEESINKDIEIRMENAAKDFEDERDVLNKKKEDLENMYKELNNAAIRLEKMSSGFNSQLQVLKDREEYLGICYWKSLGVVTKIETYW